MKLLNNIRDAIRTTFYKKLFDFPNKKNKNPKWENINSVVICKIDGKLGDTQIVSPFISTIQKTYPHITITVLCSREMSDIYMRCFGVVNTIVCSRRPKSSELRQIAHTIGQCDLFITLEAKFRFHDFYILNLLHPPFVAGINNSVKSINIDISQNKNKAHITDYFNNLLALGGIDERYIQHEYIPLVTPEAITKATPFCKSGQIAFAPWGASKHRRLADNTIVEITQLITNKKHPVALLVPPEGNYLKSIIKSAVDPNLLIDVPERLTIYELSAFIKNSCAIVSVDTANIHLACAFNLDIFGIYNATTPDQTKLWAPKSKGKTTTVFYKKEKTIDKLSISDIKPNLSLFLDSI